VTSLEEWVALRNIRALERKLDDPRFEDEREEIERQLAELRLLPPQPRRPLFGR
jgi:hypothetical protein